MLTKFIIDFILILEKCALEKGALIFMLYNQLWHKCKACLDEIIKLHEYINSIEDSETRQILRMRYVEGMTLKQIGQEMGYDLSVVGKKIKKAVV